MVIAFARFILLPECENDQAQRPVWMLTSLLPNYQKKAGLIDIV